MASRSDFGSRLRQARERKGVSLRDIATKTKISVSALEALERNDISRLPGGIFSRAFVRSYAIEVGLDPDITAQDFIEQFPHDSVTAGTPHSSQADDNEAIESDRRVAETVLKLLLISVPIAGALIYFGVTGRRPVPEPPSAEPPAVAADVAVPSAPAVAASSTSSVEIPSTANVPASSSSVPAPSTSSLTPTLVVFVRATSPCWVSASADGKRQAGRTFQTGEELKLSAASEVILTAGDGAALELTINGAPARPLGVVGQVVTKRITPQNYKALLQ